MVLAKLKEKYERLYTVDEYLKMEREAEERHEYIDGEIFQMAGESDEHGIISVNLTSLLHQQLKGRDCQARVKDAKIKSGGFSRKEGQSTKGMFSYPDLVVICGEVKYHDKKRTLFSIRKLLSKFSRNQPKFSTGTTNSRAAGCLTKR